MFPEELSASIIIAVMMKAVSSCETSVNICQITRRNIPEGSHIHLVFRILDQMITFDKVMCMLLFSSFMLLK
jgi:hypothetical protein